MRPSKDAKEVMLNGLWRAIVDEAPDEGSIAALAFVLEEFPYAHLSGPKTPLASYPSVVHDEGFPVMQTLTSTAFQKRLVAVIAQLDAEGCNTTACARRVWPIFREVHTDREHSVLLGQLLESTVLSPHHRELDPKDLWFNVDNEEAQANSCCTLWKHREVLRQLHGIFVSDLLQTKTACGDRVFTLLATIGDSYERAVVLGHILWRN